MTIWREENWDRTLKERLSNDVYRFICKDNKLISYLSDSHYVVNHLKNQTSTYQFDDNSPLVLHICKFFEGVLYLIAREIGWFGAFNNGNEPTSIRMFYLNNRNNIEQFIDSQNNITSDKKQEIKDRLFSTVQDFKERHLAVHYGSMLQAGEIDNYDAIITKTKDIIKILLDEHLISL